MHDKKAALHQEHQMLKTQQCTKDHSFKYGGMKFLWKNQYRAFKVSISNEVFVEEFEWKIYHVKGEASSF